MERIRLAKVSKRYWKLSGTRLVLSGLPGRLRSSRNWFWALEKISFCLPAGRSLGIIGPNGSGKSTLLRIIAGVTQPTRGSVTIFGRVTPVLELFAGMQPDLTGRENIYLSGLILGMRRQEIRQKFARLVDFAGVQPFLDMPLKHYSSGMAMRLGFSIAIHAESDILLLDEAWGIGDAEFQAKSFERLQELRKRAALLLVSHDPKVLLQLTDEILWLDRGRLEALGPSQEILHRYAQAISASHP